MDGVVRVLEFTIGAREFTGIASFLYQYYKRIDRNRVRLDFSSAGKIPWISLKMT